MGRLTRSASSDMAWMVVAWRKGWISMMLMTLCSRCPDSTTLWMVPLSVGGEQRVREQVSHHLQAKQLPSGLDCPGKAWVGDGGKSWPGEGHRTR